MALVEESAITSLDYVKTLPANEQKEYAKAFHKFNSLYQNWKIKHVEVSTIFVDPIRLKDVKLKKGKRCGLSLRKVLKEKIVEKQWQRQAESIKQAWLERYNTLLQSQNNINNPNAFFQDSNWPSQQISNLSD